ncbi:NADPH:adrenodoxin oxidoreductase, mitochondrial [Armadillidium vulgare]|nr:NADPH:adrenodoxin oxidoreductase, mitochondrial [Armadillidium vulgare]
MISQFYKKFIKTYATYSSSRAYAQVCIVGSGPAGFYTAQHILKKHPDAQVDIYERLPVPFGLVRYGVAPDHPEVKNCINGFTELSKNERFSFIGNVTIGKDVTLNQLKEAYHAVVMKTDIPEPVLEKFSKSRIKSVTMVGRRRVQDAPFTVKEVREMINLNNVRPDFRKEDFEHLSSLLPDAPRQKKRLWDLLYKTSCRPSADQLEKWNKASRNWGLRFQLSPSQILPNENNTGVSGIKCTINRIEDGKAVPTDETEIIECGLVLRSIGYFGTPIDPSLPFNSEVGAIPSINGKVREVPGLYASGWIATGPVGVLLSTMQSAFTTAEVIVSDINSKEIILTEKEGKKQIIQILANKKIFPVSFENWCLINRREIEDGNVLGKPREKITSVQKMLEIAHKDQI